MQTYLILGIINQGARHGEEPIYATPIFPKGSSGHSRQRELHYMVSWSWSSLEILRILLMFDVV